MILPDAALAQHIAITGRTGSGKTFACKGFVEHLLDLGRRVCIIDPTDAWFGLRSSADGNRPGYPVIVFGGDHADVPINAHSGAALAEFVATQNAPSIIATADMHIDERRRFMADFLDGLYRLNKGPLHLIVDEADEIGPQNPMPDTKVVLHRIDRIVRRGRIRGFRVIMITQRPAVLNKNLLTQASTLIAMRLMAPQDRKAIDAWIEGQGDVAKGKEVLGSLATLRRGEGWVWSPDFDILKRVEFPRIKTFDSSRAPTEGEAAEPTEFADVDLTAIRQAFAAAEAEAAANDPKLLRKRIAELEREAKRAQPEADPAALERAREEGRRRGQAGALRHLAAVAEELRDKVVDMLTTSAEMWRVEAERDYGPQGSDIAGRPPAKPAAKYSENYSQTVPAAPRPPRPKANGLAGELHSAARAMLAELAAIAPAMVTWSTVATLAGLKARGGHFNAGRKDLVDRGLIVIQGDLIGADVPALAMFGADRPQPKSPGEILEMWCSKLPAPGPEMLRALVRAPSGMTRDGLAAFLGKKPIGGHWNSGMKLLRDNGLIVADGDRWRIAPLMRASA